VAAVGSGDATGVAWRAVVKGGPNMWYWAVEAATDARA
jgi:hypothetical protein